MPSAGARKIPFSRVLYIEADDFMKDPPKKFFRLSPGNEVRLRYAYILKCERVITDSAGVPTRAQVHDRNRVAERRHGSASGKGHDPLGVRRACHRGRSAALRSPVPSEDPGEGGRDPLTDLNPESLTVLTGCKVESMLAGASAGERFQFERQGYFCVDPDSQPTAPVFNRTVTLKDTWAKISGKAGQVSSAPVLLGPLPQLCARDCGLNFS